MQQLPEARFQNQPLSPPQLSALDAYALQNGLVQQPKAA
jgi:hypothetical protein